MTGHLYAFNKEDFDKHFKLMPQPQKIEIISGKGIHYNTLRAILLKGISAKPVLYGSLKSLPLTSETGAGILELSLTDAKNFSGSKEGYSININDKKVVIKAGGTAGLFYGCATLSQLLEDAEAQQIEIPACTITDYPDIAYRAVHLDLKHHLDAAGYYYDITDRLARVKVNAIIVEFEDKLRYRKAPKVGASNAISVGEFALISRYAKERNIEISPLVQGLGHASFILKHDEYKNLRDTISSDWSFDPMNPGTYRLQFSLYEDAIAATPYGKYLHVGGDEVGHLGMSELSKKSGPTPMKLQMQWLTKVCNFATKHNRIPIFWDDMVFKLSDLYR
jgi:N-acetyl-beta-hexosaminidase